MPLKCGQILHTELEASLQKATQDLEYTQADLDKQKTLNDKLENDLLELERGKPNGGILSPPEIGSIDGLSGLDLKKPSSVCHLVFYTCGQYLT